MKTKLTHIALLLVLTFVAGCASTSRGRVTGQPPEIYVTERGKAGERFTPQASSSNTIDTLFAGKHRKVPKTAIDPAALEEEYTSLEELLDTLPSDQDMQEQFDDLVEESGDSSARFASFRLPDEQRNVRVRAWIYAAKSESDKDFHVIIGSSPTKDDATFMNVEVSGLPNPASTDTTVIRRTREQLRDLMGKLPGSKYHKVSDPVEVEIEGSLFYDIDHQPGVVGPYDMRPTVAWEIHPISAIQVGHD